MNTLTSGLRLVSVISATSTSFSSRKLRSSIILFGSEQAFQLTSFTLVAIFNDEKAQSVDLVEPGFAASQASHKIAEYRCELLR